MACVCGCTADAPDGHAIARALAVDDLDAALAAGLLSAPGCLHCTPACRQGVDAARAARMQALDARERYRARAARLARREAELQARRRAATDALTAAHVPAGTIEASTLRAQTAAPPVPSASPALPTAAAEALARAKARAALRHPR